MRSLHVLYMLIGSLVISGIPTDAQNQVTTAEAQIVEVKMGVSNVRTIITEPQNNLLAFLDFSASVVSPASATITNVSLTADFEAYKNAIVDDISYYFMSRTTNVPIKNFELPVTTQLQL